MPDLPEFQLSLRPDDYELPEIDPAWDSKNWKSLGQPLKEHLRDSDEHDENPTDWEIWMVFFLLYFVVEYMLECQSSSIHANTIIEYQGYYSLYDSQVTKS